MLGNKTALAVVGMVIVTVFFLLPVGYGAFSAEGAPSTPWATLSVPLSPSTATTEQVTFYTQVQSVQPPNSIDLLGSRLVYSAWQTNSLGGQTALAVNQQSAFNVLNVTNGPGISKWYTLATTITFSLTSTCSGAGCVGTIFNLTVRATAHVSTYWSEWVSPTTTIVFSNTQIYNTPTGPTALPSQVQFNYEFWGPIFVIVAADLLLLAVAISNPWPIIGAVGGFAVAAAFFTGFAGL